jgi:hypothetical protein
MHPVRSGLPSGSWFAVVVFALAALAPAACSSKKSDEMSAVAVESAPGAPAGGDGEKAQLAQADGGKNRGGAPGRRRIIRTGSITLEVADYEKVRAAINNLVVGSGGFVASTEVARSEGAVSSAVLVLRIPEADLDGTVAALSRLGSLRGESLRAEDVTDQYQDLEARLRNARRLEERMLELAARAGGVKDLLQVEQEVARVREGIEVMDGQLRGLTDRTSLATLTVSLLSQGTYQPEPDPGLGTKISKVFDASIEGLAAAAEALLLFLVAALPWLLPIAILALALRRPLMRRWRR